MRSLNGHALVNGMKRAKAFGTGFVLGLMMFDDVSGSYFEAAFVSKMFFTVITLSVLKVAVFLQKEWMTTSRFWCVWNLMILGFERSSQRRRLRRRRSRR